MNTVKLQTTKPIEIIDITDKVKDIVVEVGVRNGLINIITQHTTTAININEREPGLQEDMLRFLTEFVPREAGYTHDKNAADGRPNAHSHLMTMFTNASETIPIEDGKMLLGNWQSIFFIELDGPREERKVIVKIIGE